ncbi:MAG: RadC family protein [Tenacibaculum sp.]
MKKMPIKTWAFDDRPREKMLNKGKNALSDAELIAILIGSGSRDESAVELSKRILKHAGNNLNKLSKLSVEELKEFKGIGEAKAISIVTALELGKRRHFEKKEPILKITSSENVASIMQPLIGDLEYEEFWVLYLNNANRILAKRQISKGGLTATLVDIRILFKKALEYSTVGIVLCHNHPSGKLKPSTADIELTKRIKQAAITLDIKLLDHLIITEKDYFSFANQGFL